MAEKPESGPKIWHILVPAATTVVVALIGLFSAVYQTEKPIQLTAAALSSTQTAALTVQPTQAQAAQATPPPGTTAPATLPAKTAIPVPSATQPAKTAIPVPSATLPARTDIPVPQATLPATSIQIRNSLVLPVKISIDSVDKGELEDGGRKTYLLDHFPVTLKWSLVKQTSENGTPLGHAMGGTFTNIAAGDEITIDALVEDQPYFYPMITNLTRTDCDVTINQGWKSEFITHAVASAQTDKIGFGYYELYTNSNVVLDCGGQVYWWGTRPDETDPTSFFEDVDKDSGVIEFTLKIPSQ